MPPLSPDRWRALSPYLDEALEIAAEDRAAWLASIRGARRGARRRSADAARRARCRSTSRVFWNAPCRCRRARADAVAGGTDHRRLPAGLAHRPGRDGQRLAGRALRRPLRGTRGGQAAEHRADGPRRRGAIPARRQHPRPAHAPAHRAPHRCRRVADGPAVSRARARRRSDASTAIATSTRWASRRASVCSSTCWRRSRTRTPT